MQDIPDVDYAETKIYKVVIRGHSQGTGIAEFTKNLNRQKTLILELCTAILGATSSFFGIHDL